MISVCIVDDEELICKSLIHRLAMVPDPVNFAGEAATVRSALELYQRCQPDIMLVDIKLSDGTGLELISKIQSMYPDNRTCFIIISGYDDYAFMQQAILLGIHNYLKKPIVQEEFNAAISRAVRFIRESREKDHADHQAQNQPEKFAAFTQHYESGTDNGASFYYCFCRGGKLSRLEELFRAYRGSLLHCAELPWTDQVLLFCADPPADEKSFYKLAEQADHCCEQAVYGSFPAGTELSSILKQAEEAFNTRFISGVPKTLNMNTLHNEKAHNLDTGVLRAALANAEMPQCRAIIDGILERFTKSRQHALELRYAYREIILLFLSLYQSTEKLTPVQLELELMPFSTSRYISIEHMQNTLCAYCEELMLQMKSEQEETDLVGQVRNYLNEHYMDDLRLPDLAKHFFVSINYLSMRFKEKEKITLISYLENLRMEKASSLLSSTGISISEICRLTGYNDISYFNRVFKKHQGVAPSEYRRKSRYEAK